MTEQEWQTCEDPQRMLRSLCREWEKGGEYYIASDRKLRLFACACCREFSYHMLPQYKLVEESDGSRDDFAKHLLTLIQVVDLWVATNWSSGNPLLPERPPKDRVMLARILRDIIGNPFRPVTVHRLYRSGEPDAPQVIKDNNDEVVLDLCRDCGKGESELSGPCRWLTPQVLTLAQAAYEERETVRCLRCLGSGRMEKNGSDHPCPDCHGGHVVTGHLDPVRLAVLADALVDAGVPEELECGACDGKGWHPGDMGCRACGADAPGSVGTGRVPHPLLAHLRSSGPHYRGCWAVDALTGRS